MTAKPFAIVAIPAQNEAGRIEACIAALATQRDGAGAPIASGTFGILVFANNCEDDTVAVVEGLARLCPHPITCVAEALPSGQAHAGGARRRAMDLAADALEGSGRTDGIILTTDADSWAAPTWLSATLAAFQRGVDGVAGYVDAHPPEIMALGAGFLDRSRREDSYLRAVAEIKALCDPQAHDPWPNHRVSSGASLAVTLAAYRRIGGLPALPLGEDAALTRTLLRAGLKVCHPMDVVVSTSCRFDGRAKGGAADTIRFRHETPEAPCDDDLERARTVLLRATWKGRLRQAKERNTCLSPRWTALGLSHDLVEIFSYRLAEEAVEPVWDAIEAASPVLTRKPPLRPSDLPVETARAHAILRRLRRRIRRRMFGIGALDTAQPNSRAPWTLGRGAPPSGSGEPILINGG